MSTYEYRPNGENTQPVYQIGTIGWEAPQAPELELGDVFRYLKQLPDAALPTYGYWAGPGWSPGVEDEEGNQLRPTENSQIDWEINPCYNNNIKSSSTPDQCYSIIDAICKSHDWSYYQAEENGNNRDMIIAADIQLLEDIAAAIVPGGSYDTTIYNENGTPIDTTLTGTFDITEKEYTALILPAFTAKLVLWDTPTMLLSEAMEAFNTAWDSLGDTDVTYTDPTDASKMIHVQDQTKGIIYENKEGSTDICWALDAGAQKVYNAGEIVFGDSSVAADNTFVYEGDGKITINGGTGDDKITMGENDDPTYYTLAGGAGVDSYFLTDGDSFIINDSGENQIYKEDASGGYFSVGDFYKDATDANWHSADGSEHFSQGSDGLWTITFEDGSTVELDDNFQSGDFGINLINEPTNPTTDNTITGDLTPVDFDPNTEGIQTQTDQWDNIIVDPNQSSPGRADTIYDTSGNDMIVGGGGDDVINTVRGGDDWIKGGDGNDIIAVNFGFNGTRGTLLNSVIEGGSGSDIILGHYTVSNQLFGDSYGDMETLIAAGETAEDNGFKGDFISDYYLYDYGQNSSKGFIYGSNGRDILINNTGQGLIVGGGGDDLIYGDFDGIINTNNNNTWAYTIDVSTDENGATSYSSNITGIGITNNTAVGAGDDDVIYAGTGNDFVSAGGGDDEVYGGTGNDTIFGEAGNDFIEGGDGNDVLIGDNASLPTSLQGDDYIDGGDGNDYIVDQGGNNELYGGAGNDSIGGGSGDDYIDGEDGDDYIVDQSGNNELYGGAGADTIYGGDGDDYLDGEAGTDSLYGGAGNDVMFGGDGNDHMEGDYADRAQGNDYLDGEAGDDILIGGGGADTIFGGDGNDSLYGDAENVALADQGDDYLDGGTGNDYMMGMDGLDTIYGGDGNDSIWGGDGNDSIYGEAGNDQLSGEAGDDYIDGGDGNDLLQGGTGNDTLIGGSGNDTYFYNLGDGSDTIVDTAANGEVNVLIFGNGITFDDLQLNVGSLDILVGNNGDVIHFDDFDPNDAYGSHAIDSFEFADGTELTYSQLIDLGFEITGTSGDDQLSGTSAADRMMGLDGNDYIASGAGNDYIDGGPGDDTLYGGTNTDCDLLHDVEGANTYIFNRGSGLDVIEVRLTADHASGDTVVFGEGITPEDLSVQSSEFFGYPALSVDIGNNDGILITGVLSDGENLGVSDLAVQRFVFADGQELTLEQVLARADSGVIGEQYGTEGDDYLLGSVADDYIYGEAGNDVIDGRGYGDWLEGDAGNVFFSKVKMFVDNRLAA